MEVERATCPGQSAFDLVMFSAMWLAFRRNQNLSIRRRKTDDASMNCLDFVGVPWRQKWSFAVPQV